MKTALSSRGRADEREPPPRKRGLARSKRMNKQTRHIFSQKAMTR